MRHKNSSTPSADSTCDVCSPAEALKRAKEELDKAQAFYEKVRQQAAERLKSVGETSLADMVDCTLEAVKRRPGTSLTIAAIVGFFLGRLFRR